MVTVAALAEWIPADSTQPRRVILARRGQTELTMGDIADYVGNPLEVTELRDGRRLWSNALARSSGDRANGRATVIAELTDSIICGPAVVTN